MPAERAMRPDGDQYLRLKTAGAEFLLSSDASVAIDQREQLIPEEGHPCIVAWRAVLSDRWPVFHLDASFQSRSQESWEKAVFIDALPHPVGIAASDILLLPSDVRVEPFTLLGVPLTVSGHLFSGAWVQGADVLLSFSTPALIAHLRRLGGLS